MTLITLTRSNGTTRSCSARCHNAKQPPCKCICGGTLHGVGLEAATDIIRDANPQLIKALFDQGRPHFNHVQLRLPFTETLLIG